jgi:coproporphyrinogen III oxidase-like Fe-S oxidoreductase
MIQRARFESLWQLVNLFVSTILLIPRAKTLKLGSGENSWGIYIHVPFCRRRCYYCDFPVNIVGDNPNSQATASKSYSELILNEISLFHRFTKKSSLEVDSIYFGGGTPSLMRIEGNFIVFVHHLYSFFLPKICKVLFTN